MSKYERKPAGTFLWPNYIFAMSVKKFAYIQKTRYTVNQLAF